MTRKEDSQHELGRHRGTFYRVCDGTRVVASFQEMKDAISFSKDTSYDVYIVDHYENGVEDRLFSLAKS